MNSTNKPPNLTGTLANFEMRAQIPVGENQDNTHRTELSEFEMCQKAPLAGMKTEGITKKERREHKKEAKLRKLRKLEKMAQGSMSRITSNLTS